LLIKFEAAEQSDKSMAYTKLMFGYNIIFAGFAMASCFNGGKSLNLTFQKFASSSVSSKWPTVLFIHGLDSSKHTWRDVNRRMQSDGFDSMSIDLRGWGSSPLGEREDYNIENVISDIKTFVDTHCKRNAPLIVVGHSMGGRVASCYAAKHPGDVAALVIEDMDIAVRIMANNPVSMVENKLLNWNRSFQTKDIAIEALTDAGYGMDRLDKWLIEGRLREMEDGTWWSDVNPEARMLSYRNILGTDCGEQALRTIASCTTFPCHLMVAEIGSACENNSIQEMKAIMGERMCVTHYVGANHSIHNSAQDKFLEDLKDLIRRTSQNC